MPNPTINPTQSAKTVVHVRCSSCKLEQLGHVGAKCWKCPKGYAQFIGGEAIKTRLLAQQKATRETT